MGDGKALQMGTSHELGQNFARAFGIQYSTATGAQEYVWQTSWGASTRLVGALIMAHGDDAGLRLPPQLAPIEVVVLVVKEGEGVAVAATQLVTELRDAGHRVRLDDRVDVSFGRRSIDWELKGVPIRLEVGPRDLAGGQVTVVRRDLREKKSVPVTGAAQHVLDALVDAQRGLLREAQARMEERTARVKTVDEAAEAATAGFATLPWDAVGVEGEARLAEAGVSVRCLQRADGSLALAHDEPGLVAVVAKAY